MFEVCNSIPFSKYFTRGKKPSKLVIAWKGNISNLLEIVTLLYTQLHQIVLAIQVKPCLEKLSQDADHDVQYFANDALE
ncbi:unnamed protein product, partial [Rotaria magnacalcarata]